MTQWLRDVRQAFRVGMTRYRNLRYQAKRRALIKDPF